jgi:hypothetical protein
VRPPQSRRKRATAPNTDGIGQLRRNRPNALKSDEIGQSHKRPLKSDIRRRRCTKPTKSTQGRPKRTSHTPQGQGGQLANQTNNSDKSRTKRTIRATADHLAQPSQPALLPTKWDPHAQGRTIRTCGSRSSALSNLVRIRRQDSVGSLLSGSHAIVREEALCGIR